MGGILSLNRTEEDFFAERIAKSTEAWHGEGMNSWADMEMWLKDIAWVDSLRTPECVSLWNRAQTPFRKGPGKGGPVRGSCPSVLLLLMNDRVSQ